MHVTVYDCFDSGTNEVDEGGYSHLQPTVEYVALHKANHVLSFSHS